MLHVPEHVNLALHAAGVLAMHDPLEPVPVSDIARKLDVSRDHLAKVMQRLVRAGLVVSRRGPHGGFVLARAPGAIRLSDVYEAVAGPLPRPACPLRGQLCDGRGCLFGDALVEAQARITDHLRATTLAGLRWPHLALAGARERGGRGVARDSRGRAGRRPADGCAAPRSSRKRRGSPA